MRDFEIITHDAIAQFFDKRDCILTDHFIIPIQHMVEFNYCGKHVKIKIPSFDSVAGLTMASKNDESIGFTLHGIPLKLNEDFWITEK